MTLPRAVGEDLNVTPIIVSTEAELQDLYNQGLRWNNTNSGTLQGDFVVGDTYKGEYKDGKTQIDAQLAAQPWLLIRFSSDNPMNYGNVTLTKIGVSGASQKETQTAGTWAGTQKYEANTWHGRTHTFYANFDFVKIGDATNTLGYESGLPAAGSTVTITYTVGSGNDTQTFTKTVAFPTIVVPEKVQADATPAPETPSN